jgi:ABC-type multidrug transport system ATPase subunit
MLRLLGVAVAGVGDPDLVVLDEPTSGLDRTMTRRVFESCATLADARCGVVVATHDLPTVEGVADRALLLDRGRLQADRRLPIEATTLGRVYDDAVDGETTVRSGRGLTASDSESGSDFGPDSDPDVGPDSDPDVGPDSDPDFGPDSDPDVGGESA